MTRQPLWVQAALYPPPAPALPLMPPPAMLLPLLACAQTLLSEALPRPLLLALVLLLLLGQSLSGAEWELARGWSGWAGLGGPLYTCCLPTDSCCPA